MWVLYDSRCNRNAAMFPWHCGDIPPDVSVWKTSSRNQNLQMVVVLDGDVASHEPIRSVLGRFISIAKSQRLLSQKFLTSVLNFIRLAAPHFKMTLLLTILFPRRRKTSHLHKCKKSTFEASGIVAQQLAAASDGHCGDSSSCLTH